MEFKDLLKADKDTISQYLNSKRLTPRQRMQLIYRFNSLNNANNLYKNNINEQINEQMVKASNIVHLEKTYLRTELIQNTSTNISDKVIKSLAINQFKRDYINQLANIKNIDYHTIINGNNITVWCDINNKLDVTSSENIENNDQIVTAQEVSDKGEKAQEVKQIEQQQTTPQPNNNQQYIATGKSTTKNEWLKTRINKYQDVHKLDASQEDPKNKHYINFKQDYVVLIRKKPFFAATAQQRRESGVKTQVNVKTGEITYNDTYNDVLRDKQNRQVLPEDNYLRAYQVNNFLNISINTSVHQPGTCSVTLKGAERVVCAENTQQSSNGWFSWSDLVGGWINVDEDAVLGDGTGKKYTTSSALNLEKEAEQNRKNDSDVNASQKRGKTYNYDSNFATGQSWRKAEQHWAGVQNGPFDTDTTFRNLFKTREAKYGWRFAEKCDWEPMDEILIFGKSLTLRVDDPELDSRSRDSNNILTGYHHNNTSMFKMEQIFFGYIEQINKTYDASRGCVISITAKDHLKLLEQARTSTNFGSVSPGTNNYIPVLDWSKLEYGLVRVINPILYMTIQKDGTVVPSGTQDPDISFSSLEEKSQYYPRFLGCNWTGWYPDEIVQILSCQAGVPEKFLVKRVEPLHQFCPFLIDPDTQKSIDIFNGQSETVLSICKKAAEKLMLELFADEEGNIVLKIPNWALGVNLLQMNNCNIRYPDWGRNSKIPELKVETDDQGIPQVGVAGGGTSDAQPSAAGGGLAGLISQAIGGLINGLLKGISNIFNFSGDMPPNAKPEQVGAEYQFAPGSKGNPNDNIIQGDEGSSSGSYINDLNIWGLADNTTYASVTPEVINDILNENIKNVWRLTDHSIAVRVGRWYESHIGSLYNIAQRYYGSGKKWQIIAEYNDIKDPTEVVPGQIIEVIFDEALSDYMLTSNENDKLADTPNEYTSELNKIVKNDNIISSFENQNSNITVHTSEDEDSQTDNRKTYTQAIKEEQERKEKEKREKIQKEEAAKQQAINEANTESRNKQLNKFLSGRTDIDIPALKSEYVVSFTLMDSDQDVYNYISIGGTNNFKFQQGEGMTKVNRALPLFDNLCQFGLRAHPAMEANVLCGTPALAELMGAMLLYKSQANRYKAVVTAIDDSAVRVGNPIRLYLYDEHPFRPATYIKAINSAPVSNNSDPQQITEKQEEQQQVTDVNVSFDNYVYKHDLSPSYLNESAQPTKNNDSTPDGNKAVIEAQERVRLAEERYAEAVQNYNNCYNELSPKIQQLNNLKRQQVNSDNEKINQILKDYDSQKAAIEQQKNTVSQETYNTQIEQLNEKVKRQLASYGYGDLEKARQAIQTNATTPNANEQQIQQLQSEIDKLQAELSTYQTELDTNKETLQREQDLLNDIYKQQGQMPADIKDEDINDDNIDYKIVSITPPALKQIEITESNATSALNNELNKSMISLQIANAILQRTKNKTVQEYYTKVQNSIQIFMNAVKQTFVPGAKITVDYAKGTIKGQITLQQGANTNVQQIIDNNLNGIPDDQEEEAMLFDEKIFREQAVFYIESMSRSIDVQNVSTMTLQLRAGRMMGQASCYDIMSYFYELYYQPWQSREYYYAKGGNNTAIVNLHATDMSKEMEEHIAYLQAQNVDYAIVNTDTEADRAAGIERVTEAGRNNVTGQ